MRLLSVSTFDTETFMAKLGKEQIMVGAEMVGRGASVRQLARAVGGVAEHVKMTFPPNQVQF